jgi:hypothetical protein
MQFFKELGLVVEQRWRDKNYSEELFPEIAEQALREMDAVGRVDPWALIHHLQQGLELPAQQEQDFGDVTITVYAAPRFRIDVYFWLDGTTSIHEHGFTGAFQVFLGSSIHSLYSFEREQEINAHFSVGRVLLKGVEGLGKGDIRRIFPGGEFIHALFHLDRPSATITIRTHQSPSALPQHCYLKPYLAFDPFYKEPLTGQKIQSVRMLLKMRHPEAYSLIGQIISCADFQTVFQTLEAAFYHLVAMAQQSRTCAWDGQPPPPEEWEHFQELFKKAHHKHGRLVTLLPPVIGEMQRESVLVELRSQITEPEHRFFLALLLNLPHRALILDMVKRRFPHLDPIDKICCWMAELSTVKSVRSPEMSILGAGGFGDEHLFLLRRLLTGDSIDQVKDLLKKDVPTRNMERTASIENLYKTFNNSVLMKSLLAKTPTAFLGASDTVAIESDAYPK